ncbi:MAG: hypothetical protein KAQ65_03165 [Candidatus Thorarchaeota archaeon]|nr:hypothetical protein [Candidatus Thorarchaeota archaeon]MCK5239023.1 hypothetical protein [Candidatus Thorarchaeota archaeon]
MITSGASGTLGYLPQMQEAVNSFLSDSFLLTVEIIIGILAALTAIGGLGVIVGGLIMTTRFVEFGRITVMIAMVTGVLSLVMSLVQLLLVGMFTLPLLTQLAQSLGWIGAMMAVLGKTIAEQQPILIKS